MSKWDGVRSSFNRAHSDLYGDQTYTVTFYGYSESYNNSADEWTDTRSELGSVQAEFVPPSMDATVESDGTDLDFDTSIRVPEGASVLSQVTYYGEEGERASEAVPNAQDVTYVVQGSRPEPGSGFTLLRLREAE